MGSIALDPSEIAAAGAALRSIAASSDLSGGLTLGHVSGPAAVAGELPEFVTRWNRWIDELDAVIDDLGAGLSAAAAYYREREADLAAWTTP